MSIGFYKNRLYTTDISSALKKIKINKKSQYMVSHPETGSDSPIRSDRESRRDKNYLLIFRALHSNSPWESLVHVVPKKGGFSVIKNEKNELIYTRTVLGWSVWIYYRKLNTVTRNDHYPLPFIDQMLDRLAGQPRY